MRQVGLLLCVLATVPQAAAVGPLPHGDEIPAQSAVFGDDPLPAGAIARIGSTRFRALSAAEMAFDPAGKFLVVLDGEQVRFLDPQTGRDRLPQTPPALENIRSLGGLNADGSVLVVHGSRQLVVWDTQKNQRLYPTLAAEDDVVWYECAALSASGKVLASSSQYRVGEKFETRVSLWDLTTGKRLAVLKVPDIHRLRVALSPDGKCVAVTGLPGPPSLAEAGRIRTPLEPLARVELWETIGGQHRKTLHLGGPCVGIQFSPDGRLALMESPSSVSFWDVTQGKQLHRFLGTRGNRNLMAFSPDGKILATGDDQGRVLVWDLVTGRKLSQSSSLANTFLSALMVQPDHRAIAAGVCGTTIRIWDAVSGKEQTPPRDDYFSVSALAFSPDGQSLSSSDRNRFLVRDLKTGKINRNRPSQAYWRMAQRIAQPLSTTGRYWAPGTGEIIDTQKGHAIARVREEYAISPDETTLAQLDEEEPTHGQPCTFTMSSLKSGRHLQTIDLVRKRRCLTAAVSPGGKWLAVLGSEDTESDLDLYDAKTGKVWQQYEFARDEQFRVTFGPDEDLLAVSGKTLRLFDALTGASLVQEQYGDLGPACFSPDGRILAACSWNDSGPETVLLELASGGIRARLSGKQGGVLSLAFSPDGRVLATGGHDATILLWDMLGQHKNPLTNPTRVQLAAWWADLANTDASRAFHAMGHLLAAPTELLALCRKELKPAPGKTLSEAEMEQLIAQLGSNTFAERQAATQRLTTQSLGIRAFLIRMINTTVDREIHRRLRQVLRAQSRISPVESELLRSLRALEMLERLGTAEARRIVETLAGGNANSRQTLDAVATLRRMRSDVPKE